MTALRNMKIRKRLLISFMCILSMASFSSILSVILIIGLNSRYDKALEMNGFIQGDIGEYNTYLNRGGALVRDILILTNEQEIYTAKADLAECDARVENYLYLFEGLLETDEERRLVADIKEQYAVYLQYRQEAMKLDEENRDEEALEVFLKRAVPYLNQIVEDSEQLLAMNVEMGDRVAGVLSKGSVVMVLLILVFLTVAMGGCLWFSFYTANDVEKPLVQLMNATKKIAEGDLDIHLETEFENEFGDMADSFNTAVSKLRSYLECIDYGLEEIGRGNFRVRPTVEFSGEFIRIKEAIEEIILKLNGTIQQIDDGAAQVSVGATQLAQGA